MLTLFYWPPARVFMCQAALSCCRHAISGAVVHPDPSSDPINLAVNPPNTRGSEKTVPVLDPAECVS